MNYTAQFIVAGYANPEGHHVSHFNNLEEIAWALRSTHESAERVGAAYEPSEAVIFHGHHDDVTDMYPDRVATIGPRGGVQFA